MSNVYQPWVEYPHIWKTESAFLSFIRGGIRRHLWSKNPIKLEFMKDKKIEIPNTNPKSMKRFPTVKGGRCECCGELFKQTDLEVDHRTGEHSLKSLNDLQAFVEGIVLVRKEDLALLCKPCHKIKTYAERYGMTIAEAGPIKQAIEFEKKGVKKVVAFLKANGYNAGSNQEKRRDQLIDHFTKETK